MLGDMLGDVRQATAERLCLALVISAGAHFAVLAHAPLAPGLGEAGTLAARPLTARLEPALEAPQVPERIPPPPWPETKPIPSPQPEAGLAQAAALPSAEIYFRGSEVDERATPLNEVNLVYPEAALDAGQAGTVTLRLKIDHLGVLRDTAVVDATPAGVFEKAALDAVRELRFRPALRNGVPVGSVKTIEVPFHPDCKLTGSCITRALGTLGEPPPR